MLIKFDKMQALGNDFVIIDSNQLQTKQVICKNFLTKISNRIYGIGCNLVAMYKLQNDIIFASFFNSDGSEAEICGNAARCLGLLAKKRNNLSKYMLQTKKKTYSIQVNDSISVEMGNISFKPEEIGLSDLSINTLSVMDKLGLSNDSVIYAAVCASIGNPHLVLFCYSVLIKEKMESLGAILENHPLFRNRINVSFATIISGDKMDLSVFERGVGLTFACGSGACVSAAAAYNIGLLTSKKVFVAQKGGILEISIDDFGNVSQVGSAHHIFSGEIEI